MPDHTFWSDGWRHFRAPKECHKEYVDERAQRYFLFLEEVPKVMYSKDLDFGTYKTVKNNLYRAEFTAFCWPDSYILNFT